MALLLLLEPHDHVRYLLEGMVEGGSYLLMPQTVLPYAWEDGEVLGGWDVWGCDD